MLGLSLNSSKYCMQSAARTLKLGCVGRAYRDKQNEGRIVSLVQRIRPS